MKLNEHIGTLLFVLVFSFFWSVSESFGDEVNDLQVEYFDGLISVKNLSECDIADLHLTLGFDGNENLITTLIDKVTTFTSFFGFCKSCFVANYDVIPHKFSLKISEDEFRKGDGEVLTEKYQLNYLGIVYKNCSGHKKSVFNRDNFYR
jgi:hypothetical protein